MRPSGDPALFEQRRKKAISLLKKGEQPVVVARLLGVDRRSVRRWNATFRGEGLSGLRARPNNGRPHRLNNSMRIKLEKKLLKGAIAAGFPSDLWTSSRVAHLIQSCLGISYHVNHISRLLHGLGWTPQKPQRLAIERDEEAIRTWVKQDWPRIKKKPVT